jgi:hypothetical protein
MNDSSLTSESNVVTCPNNFSGQTDYILNSSDLVVNIDSLNLSSYGAASQVYTISGANDTINIGDWDFLNDNPFVDCFPDWKDFELMKKQYPAIDTAFGRLKELYDLCKDDWKSLKENT